MFTFRWRFGTLSLGNNKGEKLSEITPPLKADITSLYFTKLLNHMKKENIVKVVPKGGLIVEFILISVRYFLD